MWSNVVTALDHVRFGRHEMEERVTRCQAGPEPGVWILVGLRCRGKGMRLMVAEHEQDERSAACGLRTFERDVDLEAGESEAIETELTR